MKNEKNLIYEFILNIVFRIEFVFAFVIIYGNVIFSILACVVSS